MNPSHNRVSCKYGAPMGRGHSPLGSGKVHLARVRLDSGGYDKGGAYWGTGEPLWCAWDDEGGEVYLRAASRDATKAAILANHPDSEAVRFYR